MASISLLCSNCIDLSGESPIKHIEYVAKMWKMRKAQRAWKYFHGNLLYFLATNMHHLCIVAFSIYFFPPDNNVKNHLLNKCVSAGIGFSPALVKLINILHTPNLKWANLLWFIFYHLTCLDFKCFQMRQIFLCPHSHWNSSIYQSLITTIMICFSCHVLTEMSCYLIKV